MPKINVYLPEDLAAAVKEAGLSVSPICQRALADAVRSITSAREAIGLIRSPRFDAAQHPQVGTLIAGRMTAHLRQAIAIAFDLAGPQRPVGPEHLLVGVIDEPDNLGAHVLASLAADVPTLRDAAVALPGPRATRTQRRPTRRGEPSAGRRTAGEAPLLGGLAPDARLALARALEVAIELGHGFLGCEHLVAGLAEPRESRVRELLDEHGVTAERVRQAIPSALGAAAVGYRNARQPLAPAIADHLGDLLDRLEAVERRLTQAGL
jgi:ATP-dependent Clp protease ATP-binding subunit ClpA